MGKVGPNPQTNDRSSLVTDLVRSEDKTTNHSDPERAQTCVILVMLGPAAMVRFHFGTTTCDFP